MVATGSLHLPPSTFYLQGIDVYSTGYTGIEYTIYRLYDTWYTGFTGYDRVSAIEHKSVR